MATGSDFIGDDLLGLVNHCLISSSATRSSFGEYAFISLPLLWCCTTDAKQAVGILASHAWKQSLLELGLSTSSMMLTYGFEGELTDDSLAQKLGGRSVVVGAILCFFF